MNSFLIYLILQASVLQKLFVALAIFSFIYLLAYIFCKIAYMSTVYREWEKDEYESMGKVLKIGKKFIFLAIIFILLAGFFPSSDTLTLAFIIPALITEETLTEASNLPENLLRATNEKLTDFLNEND